MRKCKCVYCKGEFDRDKLPYVQVANLRYAHKECAERNQIQKSQLEVEYDNLVNYIEKLFGIGYFVFAFCIFCYFAYQHQKTYQKAKQVLHLVVLLGEQRNFGASIYPEFYLFDSWGGFVSQPISEGYIWVIHLYRQNHYDSYYNYRSINNFYLYPS